MSLCKCIGFIELNGKCIGSFYCRQADNTVSNETMLYKKSPLLTVQHKYSSFKGHVQQAVVIQLIYCIYNIIDVIKTFTCESIPVYISKLITG